MKTFASKKNTLLERRRMQWGQRCCVCCATAATEVGVCSQCFFGVSCQPLAVIRPVSADLRPDVYHHQQIQRRTLSGRGDTSRFATLSHVETCRDVISYKTDCMTSAVWISCLSPRETLEMSVKAFREPMDGSEIEARIASCVECLP